MFVALRRTDNQVGLHDVGGVCPVDDDVPVDWGEHVAVNGSREVDTQVLAVFGLCVRGIKKARGDLS
ncbi:MAG: hypothetical protein ABL932_24260, partial [Terricaulis sp.]